MKLAGVGRILNSGRRVVPRLGQAALLAATFIAAYRLLHLLASDA
jgi:hypothetical protein